MFHLHLYVPLRNGGWLLVAETQKATRASLGRKMMHIYEMVPRVEGAQKEMAATSAEFLCLTIIQCCSNERKIFGDPFLVFLKKCGRLLSSLHYVSIYFINEPLTHQELKSV